MAEYINREDVLEILHKVRYECVYNRQNVMYDGKVDAYKALVARVKETPSADVVERKRGKWIAKYPLSTCSVCEQNMILLDFANFCPNCGARMDGDDDV